MSPASSAPVTTPRRMLAWVLRNFPWARGWIMQMIMRLAVGKGITGEVYGTWGESTEIHKPLADPFTAALFCNRDRSRPDVRCHLQGIPRGGRVDRADIALRQGRRTGFWRRRAGRIPSG